MKVIEQSEFDEGTLSNTVANLKEDIAQLESKEQKYSDRIALVEDVMAKIQNGQLFHFANKERTEFRMTLELLNEDDLVNKVENSEYEDLLKGLQEAGMEYQADVVNERIVIETGHQHGVDSYKKQVAGVLGITLT